MQFFMLLSAILSTVLFAVSAQDISNNSTLNVEGSAHHGVDVSFEITSSAASCMKKAGISFVIPRGFKSTGSVDTAVCTSIKNAAAAGIANRDTYLFPCPTCSKSASTQMGELVNYLNDHCKSHFNGRIWLDIEGSQYWHSSTSSNKDFFVKLRESCDTHKVKCGVYSSKSQWEAIFGSASYSHGSNPSSLPLWYAHYDGKASFSDFSNFGGWTNPHAKQYQGDVTMCSTGVDKNYSPYDITADTPEDAPINV
jgi:hypothetical protein